MEELYGHLFAASEPTMDEMRETVFETYWAMALVHRKGLYEV